VTIPTAQIEAVHGILYDPVTNQSQEHWLYRVAGAPTRRQALKIALGAAAALVFPLAKSERADADSGGGCSKWLGKAGSRGP
jgi:hypothetical protein